MNFRLSVESQARCCSSSASAEEDMKGSDKSDAISEGMQEDK